MGKASKKDSRVKALVNIVRRETLHKPKQKDATSTKNSSSTSSDLRRRELDEKYRMLQERTSSLKKAVKTINKSAQSQAADESYLADSTPIQLAPPILNLFPTTHDQPTAHLANALSADYISLPSISAIEELYPEDSFAESHRVQQREYLREMQKRGRYGILEDHINDGEIGRDIKLAPATLKLS
jgi:hypothetical protein